MLFIIFKWNFHKLILLFVFLLDSINAKSYCGPSYCNNSKQHTLCKYQSQDPARHCFGYEKTIKTSEEKQAILDKLNSRRNKVASGDLRSLPRADNMMKLEWNEELEESAQRWANQCVKHSTPNIKDTCRDIGEIRLLDDSDVLSPIPMGQWRELMYVGSIRVEQNIATIFGEAPGLTPLALVDVWYMELLNFNASIIKSYQRSTDAGAAHYDYFTQLVWAKSRQVGCGGVKFKERVPDTGKEKKRAIYRLVCNFAPGGNQINDSVYTTGKPCSNCPEGACDSIYTALCSTKITKSTHMKPERIKYSLTTTKYNRDMQTITKTTTEIANANSDDEAKRDDENIDEDFSSLEYFPHFHEFISRTLATTTKKLTPCSDLLAMDDFVEMLKKKLSSDSMFKDILQNTLTTPSTGDNAFTDALALLGRIYSKDATSTTTKSSNSNYVNSTLLVDLVEAVIFRNGGNEKLNTPQESYKNTLPEIDVSPIRIQAELAEIKSNSDFTGHLFFPEDMDNGDANIENSEMYYEMPAPSAAIDEIENMRRTKATKDFLDEILESEQASESTTKLTMLSPDYVNLYKSERCHDKVVVKRDAPKTFNNIVFSIRNKRENVLQNYFNGGKPKNFILNVSPIPQKCKKSFHWSSPKDYVVKYKDLLKKLASDFKQLKLGERFHCCGSISNVHFIYNVLIFLAILGITFI